MDRGSKGIDPQGGWEGMRRRATAVQTTMPSLVQGVANEVPVCVKLSKIVATSRGEPDLGRTYAVMGH